jgi:hypothetical protein
MSLTLFISYSTKDRFYLAALKAEISKNNELEIIIVPERESPGEVLSQKVRAALERSTYVIPIIIKNSIINQWVNQEIGYSVAKDKKIIPLVKKRLFSSLKGFVNDSNELTFNYAGRRDYVKCCKKFSDYISKMTIKPQNDIVSLSSELPPAVISEIMRSLYISYEIGQTRLLNPVAPNGLLRSHSFTEKGYFFWIGRNNYKEYAFKFWNKYTPDNYIEISVDNSKKTMRIESHLDNNRSLTFIQEIKQRLNASRKIIR